MDLATLLASAGDLIMILKYALRSVVFVHFLQYQYVFNFFPRYLSLCNLSDLTLYSNHTTLCRQRLAFDE